MITSDVQLFQSVHEITAFRLKSVKKKKVKFQIVDELHDLHEPSVKCEALVDSVERVVQVLFRCVIWSCSSLC